MHDYITEVMHYPVGASQNIFITFLVRFHPLKEDHQNNCVHTGSFLADG